MRHATTLSELFVGDGREKFMPYHPLPLTRPLPMTRAQLRAQGQRVKKSGHAAHSSEGGTLWATLAYCAYMKLNYTVMHQTGIGYFVSVDP